MANISPHESVRARTPYLPEWKLTFTTCKTSLLCIGIGVAVAVDYFVCASISTGVFDH